MYKTVEEARKAAKKFVGKYDVSPVITESKLTKKARHTSFGFRFFVNEKFNSEWKKDQYGYFSRMIEIVK